MKAEIEDKLENREFQIKLGKAIEGGVGEDWITTEDGEEHRIQKLQ